MGASRAPWRRFFYVWFIAGFVVGNLTVFPTPAWAVGGVTGNLSGVVHDAADHPIAGAKVSVSAGSGSYSATTDVKGIFSLLGLPSDTYTLSIEKKGFNPIVQRGVTVLGDQTISLGSLALTPVEMRVIGRFTARPASSAFQPNQTVDVTTISGARIGQALGNIANSDEQQLLLSAPGVTVSSSGNTSLRGSTTVELGYQFDGINDTSNFLDENAGGGQFKPGGYLNGLVGGTGGSVQVVLGSGDATQGNIGAGVINIVPPRGSYPGNGFVNLGIGSPYYAHQFDLSYGLASANGKISDYFSLDLQRYAPQYAPYGADAASIGEYTGPSLVKHSDFLNNLVFRFGKADDQSLQVLLRINDEDVIGNYGGLGGAYNYIYNPAVDSGFFDPILGLYGVTATGPGTPYPNDPAFNLTQRLPYASYATAQPTQAEQIETSPTNFLKIGYTRNFGSSTFLSADLYNMSTLQTSENYAALDGTTSPFPFYNQIGGQRIGYDLTLTRQLGDKHTLSLAMKYENGYPRFEYQNVGLTYYALGLGPLGKVNGIAFGQPTVTPADWAVPTVNPNLVSNLATNPCQTGPLTGAPFVNPVPCYIHDYLVSHGMWNGTMPQFPTFGSSYHGSDFQSWGVGLRDQWQVSDKLKLDYGIREDGAQYKFGPNFMQQNTAAAYANPSDLGPSSLSPSFLTPRVIQPRAAASYQLDPNDALRASYGRSVEFAFAQFAGTPFNLSNVNPVLYQIPAIGQGTAANPTPSCGSGYNNAGGPTYVQNPNVSYDGPPFTKSPNPKAGYYFPCANLAQQIFWMFDQFVAPDYGGQGQPTFSNYDFSYQHQFSRGWLRGVAARATAFQRNGFNIFENTLLANGPPSPATGVAEAITFATTPDGVERTFGLELNLTTPERPVGWSGYLTADYLSEFQTIPGGAAAAPGQNTNLSADGFQAILPQALFGTGTLFRAGFLPPFSVNAGVEYRTKSGWKFNPILTANSGYPTGVGSTTIAYVNGNLQFIPSTNFSGATAPIGGPNGPNQTYNAPAYVDPALPGSETRPNVFATRGYNEPSLVGGKLTLPQTNLDFDIEYTTPTKYTIGLYIANVTNNHYGLPYQNTKWQPVATGVPGPQTGQNLTDPNPASAYYANYVSGVRDELPVAGAFQPFQIEYNAGTTLQLYVQKRL